MKSAYTEALARLAQIRQYNIEETSRRRDAVYCRLPRVAEIGQELMNAGAELARCILSRNSNFEHIKEKVTALQNERDNLLTQNGYPARCLDEIFNCEICGDTGFVGAEKCKCLERLILNFSMERSNLSKLLQAQTFENFDYSLFQQNSDSAKNIVKLAQNFTDNFDKNAENLFIFGNVGSGKTYLSSCIANRALARGKTLYYQSAYRIFKTVQQLTFEEKDNAELKDTLKYIYSVDLLIIDDLGTEFVTTLSTSSFFDILNTRLLDGKSTIINTNLNPSEIGQMYSERIASRIVGNYEIIHLESGDLRVK
jgi:DNA replication protein DnaC